jgi:dTMP kinase
MYDCSVHGAFLTFEGIDGCGKSTQIELLAAAIEQASGRRPIVVREPGGTPLGEQVRSMLLDHATGDIAPEAEALLYAASRAELVASVIRPALARGITVIADRFLGSSLVYQGAARGLGISRVRAANELAIGDCAPDLTILLDLEPGIAAARRQATGEAPDRIEASGHDFMCTVADAYRSCAATEPNWVVVDANADPREVHHRVVRMVAGASHLPSLEQVGVHQ